MTTKRYFSTAELAEYLGMSKKWVEKWRHAIFGATRIGRTWLFDTTLIMRLLAGGGVSAILKTSYVAPRKKYIKRVHSAECKKGFTHGT